MSEFDMDNVTIEKGLEFIQKTFIDKLLIYLETGKYDSNAAEYMACYK